MNTENLTQHERWKLANELAALQPESHKLHNYKLSDLTKQSAQERELSEEVKQKLLTYPSPLLKLFNR